MMKINIQSSLGYKVTLTQYQNLDAGSYIGIEEEIDDSANIEEKFKELNDKLTEINKQLVNDKIVVGIKNYKENVVKYKKMLDNN